jgi:chorismate mutase/prephenate dehydrogenase
VEQVPDKRSKTVKEIEELRLELAETDRRILELVAKRQTTAGEIGAVKQKKGETPRDFSQEKEVVERALQQATELGLSPGLTESLMTMLIRSSLTRQEQQQVEYHAGGHGQRVLIIGGAGRMGRWFVRFLASQGYEVEIADPAGPIEGFPFVQDWSEGELDYDVIVVAAQLRPTDEILQQLLRRKPTGLIFDIGSLKSPLRQSLKNLAEAGLRVTSMHPMFGPETELLSGRHVIFVDVGVPEATQQARRLFSSTMAIQVEMDLENHDRLIAYVLGLSHALNIAFFTALAESGEGAGRLAEMSSTTFDAQLSVASSVALDNPHLYFEIQSLNDYGTESLSGLLYAIERLRSVVRAGDEEGFATLMKKGQQYLASRKP